MKREGIIPISWEEWDEVEINIISLYRCTFIEDFGIFPKEYTANCLLVDYSKGFIEEWSEDGTKVIKKQYFKGIAYESENNIL